MSGSAGGNGIGAAGGITGTTLADLTTWFTAMDGSKGTVDLFANDISYLRGDQATLTGAIAKTYLDTTKKFKSDYMTGWNSANQKFEWTVTSTISGSFYVSALINGSSGATVNVQDGSSKVSFKLSSSGWDKVAIGQVNIPTGASKVDLSASGTFNMQFKSLELIPAASKAAIDANISSTKSTSTWMKSNPIGMMYQWGQWGGNPDGTGSTWPTCYADMDWTAFAQRIKNEGADFIVWSITWTQYYVAAPIASIDEVLTGRTSKIDYLGTMLTEFQKQGIKVIFYYHLGHDDNPNLDWWNAFWTVSSAGDYARKETAIQKWINIITEIGNRYGTMLAGWMFDDGCIYYPSPFNRLTVAARAGNPDRMVAFNPWILPRYSDYEDFAFGEGYMGGATNLSNGVYTSGKQSGQQAFGNFMTESGDWGVRTGDTAAITTTMSQATFNTIAEDAVTERSGMAFNFRMWQDGTQSQTSLDRFKAAAAAAHQ
ncbi:MAG TPA: hypothetical protein VHG72_13150 [Polyangia bacterium]|nr:hypothetical protein [Polyangia bacterium]